MTTNNSNGTQKSTLSNGVRLSSKKCIPCEAGVMPLSIQKAEDYLKEVPTWQLAPGAREISKSFSFSNFAKALAFTNAIGAIAEAEGHHPDIELGWERVTAHLSTHAIGGLSENDFILASKIDAIT